MKILVIVGHPRPQSFCEALATAFADGARQEGAEVRLVLLRDLQFDPHVIGTHDQPQTTEADLELARQALIWCDQVVLVYPTWWAGVPALLKAFLDRVLTSGFAFEETTGGTGYRGLLTPRSAQVITTMDTPWWVHRWIYGRPGELAMKRCTLEFCGLAPVRVTTFAAVKATTLQKRNEWLEQVRAAGRRAANGPTIWQQLRKNSYAWLQAMRLQFYPMTFLAYAAGAWGACNEQSISIQWPVFVVGYLFLFFLEVATVFANDVFDLESDRQNQFYGPFSGGSRVLVEGKIRRGQLVIAAAVTLGLASVAGGLSLVLAPRHDWDVVMILVGLVVLALGYTVPPLKLSHRGLGELDVCLTHSFGVILCGYVLQGGHWNSPFAWLLGVPLFCAILPAILLAGIPDRQADQATGKNTLVVKLGVFSTLILASIFVVVALAATFVWSRNALARDAYDGLAWIALPLGGWLLWNMLGLVRRDQPLRRIDGTVAVALLFIFVFASYVAATMYLAA